jgi:hypothetical protein
MAFWNAETCSSILSTNTLNEWCICWSFTHHKMIDVPICTPHSLKICFGIYPLLLVCFEFRSDVSMKISNQIITYNLLSLLVINQHVSSISSTHQPPVQQLRMGSTGTCSGFRKYGLRNFLIFLKISRILSKNKGPLCNSMMNQQMHKWSTIYMLLLLQCLYMFQRYCAILRGFVSSACQVT